ncbi:MAG: carboxypeptidase-like regulatory domain-containing protein [Acidobacteriota bacterium]|nr:carboxypeptidase-like regulatory domain-containing protein [Acidobacteriota bacterium]
MRMIRLASAFALAAVFSTPAAAQIVVGGEPMQMPSPGGRQMKTGTGLIKGRILAAETGNPVRRAQVRLSGQDVFPKSATTDNEGRFEFKDLPAGAFTINASKSGFVAVNYGQKRPFEPGKPIDLVEGQSVDNADITMPKGSVISGRILDEFGEPVADTIVNAMRSTWSNGKRRLQSTGRTATTNDLGQYRIYGLPPGDYYVSATLRGTQEMVVSEMAATMAVRTTSAIGGGAPEGPSSGYAPTYFPGTPNGNEAQKLVLALGQEAQNTDFGLFPVRLVRVRGSVVTSEGRPAEGVMVSAAPRTANDSNPLFGASSSARTDANGNFTLTGVAPGDYTLNARTSQIFTSSSDGNSMSFTMIRSSGPGGGGESSQESGSVPLTVSGDDMSNVIIVTTKGASATGRVVYDGGSKPTTNSIRISAAATDDTGPMTLVSGSSSITPEGTFEIKGLSGQRVFRVNNIPTGWVLKAVKVNGTDITDNGLEFKSAEAVTGVEVILTTKVTEVKGAVKVGNDPAMDYTVVIFSDEPEKWRVPTSRHIATGRPNQQGQFLVKNLPAGSYYAVALEYIPQGEWNDPEILDRLTSKATTFSIGEGEVKTLDLKLEGM